MNLCFISANNFQEPYPVYPIGVSYLTTYIEDHLSSCRLTIFDFNLDGGYDELHHLAKEGNFDAFALSLRNIDDNNIYSHNRFITHYETIVSTLRSAAPSVPVIIGGAGFSIFPKLLFERLHADFGIRGEGEDSLIRLLECIDSKKPVKDIQGVVYRDESGATVINGRCSYIASPRLKMSDHSVPFYFDKSGMLNVQTKRGCPFGCIYCSYPIIDGRRIRTLDTSTVIDNIREMNGKYGVDYLFFTDSVFNIVKDYNEELCHKIIESGVKINWGAYFSPTGLTEKDLGLYKKAGLTHIEWGTDTLSDTTLKTYHKGFRWKDIKETSKWASNLGIFYAHFIILGGVGETESTLRETFERSRELGFTVFFPYIGMRIYPETPLYKIALQEGVITSDENLVEPRYYVSRGIDTGSLKDMAASTGQKWIFPEDNNSPVIEKLRRKKCRGPLWEYLRY